MRMLFHIPKWLLDERFDIEYFPEGMSLMAPEKLLGSCFRVAIFDERREIICGIGKSISQAAKAARKAREDAG